MGQKRWHCSQKGNYYPTKENYECATPKKEINVSNSGRNLNDFHITSFLKCYTPIAEFLSFRKHMDVGK